MNWEPTRLLKIYLCDTCTDLRNSICQISQAMSIKYMLNKVTVPLKNLSVSKFNHKNSINRKYRHTHTHRYAYMKKWEGGREKRRQIYYKRLQKLAKHFGDLEAGSQVGKSTSRNPTGQAGAAVRQKRRADPAKGEQLQTQLLLGISSAMRSLVPFKGLSDQVWPPKDNLHDLRLIHQGLSWHLQYAFTEAPRLVFD